MRWISIEEALPKNALDVLVCTSAGHVCSGYMARKRYGEWYLHNQEIADELVIAWMHLPEPMKYSKQFCLCQIHRDPEKITIGSNGGPIQLPNKN